MEKNTQFSLTRFNRSILDALCGQRVNYGSLLAYDINRNLSVIAKYTPPGEFVGLDSALNTEIISSTDRREFYYGVSPCLDSALMIQAISELQFLDNEKLDSFIAKHHEFFTLHTSQNKYLLDMARYITLAVASNYGVVFYADERLIKIQTNLDPYGVIMKHNKNMIVMKGCPTYSILNALQEYSYKKRGDCWEIADPGTGIDIQSMYRSTENIGLINGDVFYSGVLLRPTEISIMEKHFENYKTSTLCFSFEKSTYATVFALDGNFVAHPILSDATRHNISEVLREDDRNKDILMKSIDGTDKTDDIIESVNAYLQATSNVNQIGVSANIVTSDGILLVGKRNSKSIDGGHLYPSVNGNAEVADKKVSFYKYSVYEDFPTINLNDYRIDFLGEIAREAYAELRLDIPKQDWNCFGVTISGTNFPVPQNSEPYSLTHRRMHFNLLFDATIDMSYSNIIDKSTHATESFENEKIIGIQVGYYKNKLSKCMSAIRSFFAGVLSIKDFIEASLLIILFVNSFYAYNTSMQFDISGAVSLGFAIAIIGMNLYSGINQLLTFINHRKTIKSINLYGDMVSMRIIDRFNKYLSNYTYHPVSYIAIQLHAQRYLAKMRNKE